MQKKNRVRDPPPNKKNSPLPKKISKNYFFSISIGFGEKKLFLKKKFGAGGFFWVGGNFFEIFEVNFFLFLIEIEIEKK